MVKILNEALATEIVCVLRYNATISWPRGFMRRASLRSFSSMRMRNRDTRISLRNG